jgi:hypothetical protein
MSAAINICRCFVPWPPTIWSVQQIGSILMSAASKPPFFLHYRYDLNLGKNMRFLNKNSVFKYFFMLYTKMLHTATESLLSRNRFPRDVKSFTAGRTREMHAGFSCWAVETPLHIPRIFLRSRNLRHSVQYFWLLGGRIDRNVCITNVLIQLRFDCFHFGDH